MELLLIRHGLPLRLESDRPVDPPLAPLGHAQAAALATWLEEEPPDAVATSTMARASETAEHLTELYDLTAAVDADFSEFDRGSTAYIPLEELDLTHPHMQRLINDWVGPEGAERREKFQRRVLDALDRYVVGDPGDRVALVCHGGVINVILAHVLGTDAKMFFQPGYTSVSRISLKKGRYRLLSINETGHLRGVTV